MGGKIIDKYDNEAKKLYKIHGKIYTKHFRLNIINFLAILIREGLVYGYLVYAFVIGQIGIDDFTMYLVAIVSLATAMNNLATDLSSYVGFNQYVTDLYKFLDRDLIHNENNQPIPQDYTYEIEFKNVSFKYPNTDKYILKDFNLKIRKGEKIAIVGINGAGKTTLVKLLTRLYDLEEGEILLNGININQFDKQEYYRLFSVVFQEFKMFAMSVKENIALDFENIDEDKVSDSLIKVNLSDKVQSLPKGLDTSILKIMDPQGVEFSGGENQKFAIARALYKDAPVVILDEPTASLDALAEQEIYEEFNELIKDKTAIFISHRLASTKFCDRIVLINNSSIEECGTHDELLRNKKYYYEMFMMQAKYYNSKGESYEKPKTITTFIKISFRISKSYIPVTVLMTLLDVFLVLVGIYIPKLIIDGMLNLDLSLIINRTLIGAWNSLQAQLLPIVKVIVILLSINFLFRVIRGYLNKYLSAKRIEISEKFYQELSKKIMRLEYEKIEDPEILDLKERAIFATTNQSAISNLIVYLSSMLKAIFTLAGVIAIILTLNCILFIVNSIIFSYYNNCLYIFI